MTPEQREKGVDPFDKDTYDTVQRALVYIEGNLVNEATSLLKQLLTTLDRRNIVDTLRVEPGTPGYVEIEGCAPPIGTTNGPVSIHLPAYPNELTEEILMDLKAKVDEMNRALGLMANDVKFIRAQQPYKP